MVNISGILGISILKKNNKYYIIFYDDHNNKKYCKENINYINEIDHKEISGCDTILIADIEHQLNPTSNLLNLSNVVASKIA